MRSAVVLVVFLAIGLAGCSVLSLAGGPLPCSSDDACPDGDVCLRGYCLDGDDGEGEGDIVVGEGEGDLVVGEGEGEGDIVAGEGEGDIVVGEGEGEGEVVVDTGCADGTDEGFVDHLGIRACAGAWNTPGLQHSRDVVDSAAALCAPGWHICESFFEVDTELRGQECLPDAPGVFITRQATSGAFTCGAGGNDLAGCSNDRGVEPTACGGLNTLVFCGAGDFSCDGTNSADEALKVTHSGDGGVLCCVDNPDADADGCVTETSFDIDASADAAVSAVSPDASAGRGLFLGAGVGLTSLVRFDHPAFFDPALRGVDFVLREDTTQTAGSPGRPATFRLGRFTDVWTEFRAACGAGGSLCDGVSDGVSFHGPDPSQNGTQAPWPGGEFPTPLASFGTFSFNDLNSATFTANLDADVVRSATYVDELDAGRFTFVIDDATRSTFYGSRESDHGPSLVVHRCIDR